MAWKLSDAPNSTGIMYPLYKSYSYYGRLEALPVARKPMWQLLMVNSLQRFGDYPSNHLEPFSVARTNATINSNLGHLD